MSACIVLSLFNKIPGVFLGPRQFHPTAPTPIKCILFKQQLKKTIFSQVEIPNHF